jgi:hypothetical protein
VRDLLNLRPEPRLETALYRLLYANVITALETYLSDTFVNTVLSSNEALRRYVEKAPEFNKTLIPYSDVFTAAEGAQQKVKQHLLSLAWHNLAKVQPMYREALRVDLSHCLTDVARAIAKRRDIVHRNGTNRDGQPVVVSADDVVALADTVERFAVKIEEQLSPEPEF